MKLQASPVGASSGSFIPAFCFSTDRIGDVVYIMGNKVSDTYQVTKVNINNIAHVPAVGIIILKEDATKCVVQVGGLLTGPYTALTPQKHQFIGLDSRLTEAVPSPPTIGRRAVQIIAQAIATDTLLIHIKSPIIRTVP